MWLHDFLQGGFGAPNSRWKDLSSPVFPAVISDYFAHPTMHWYRSDTSCAWFGPLAAGVVRCAPSGPLRRAVAAPPPPPDPAVETRLAACSGRRRHRRAFSLVAASRAIGGTAGRPGSGAGGGAAELRRHGAHGRRRRRARGQHERRLEPASGQQQGDCEGLHGVSNGDHRVPSMQPKARIYHGCPRPRRSRGRRSGRSGIHAWQGFCRSWRDPRGAPRCTSAGDFPGRYRVNMKCFLFVVAWLRDSMRGQRHAQRPPDPARHP